MSTVTITNRIDKETAIELKAFASEVGLSVNALVNSVIIQTLKKRQVVLDPDLRPTPYLMSVIEDADKNLRTGKNITKTNSKTEALAHLKSLMKK